MDLVTLKPWVYPTQTSNELIYYPDDAVGRLDLSGVTPTPKQPGVYYPEAVVEGYTSLIWKEGFRSAGEFELKTHDIQKTLDLLPKGTLVSLLDTNEVCIVTKLHIGTDEEDKDVLTVGGTALWVYILGNRVTRSHTLFRTGDDPNAVSTVNLIFKIPDHLAFVLYSGIVFPHSEGGYPVTRKYFDLPFNAMVPHTAISQSVSDKGGFYRTKWPPPNESRLDSVSAILDLDQKYGVRTVRPNGVSANIYTPTLTSLRGEGTMTVHHNIDKMLFDIYEGVDRTLQNDGRVMFRYDSGDIESSEYLSSIEGHKNFVSSHYEINPETFPNNKPAEMHELLWEKDQRVDKWGTPMLGNSAARKYVNGLDFRHGQVAASVNVKEEGITDANLGRIQADGYKYLRENPELEMLTADISPYTQFVYKEQYNLGDFVLVQGKYGDVQKMVVSEYTRTKEVTEERGFPTLIKWVPPIA